MAHQQDDAGAIDAPEVHDQDSAVEALRNMNIADQDEVPTNAEANEPPLDDEFTDDDLDIVEEDEGEEADEQDEPEAPAIKAPVSLTAEEKAEYSSLPKEAQDFVSRIEQRRNQDVQAVTTKAAEAQRQAEAKAANAKQEADAIMAQQVKAVADAFAPQQPHISQFQSFEQFQRAQMQYEQDKAQHDQFMQQVTSIGVETEEAKAQRFQQLENDIQKLPVIANATDKEAVVSAAMKLAEERGYDVQELASSMDAQDFDFLANAAKWKADSEKLAELRTKSKERKRDPQSGKFRSMKPNAAQPRGSGQRKAKQDSMQRLKQSGSREDAVAALSHIIKE